MKRNLSNSSGGALLFAIITAFVICFTGASLIALTNNQYRIIDDEIKRKEVYYWLRAGMEYANYMIRIGLWEEEVQDIPLPENPDVKISVIKPETADLSDYRIEVSIQY